MPDLLNKRLPSNRLSMHQLRVRLAQAEALPQLTLMGLLTGLLAGGLLILFRELVVFFSEGALQVFTETGLASHQEGVEILSPVARFLSPIMGAVLLALLIKANRPDRRSFGIAHVIERLTFNRGRLPLVSTITQFLGALIALCSGFSVGREGPAVHMGAGAGSYLGQKLRLPENTLGVLAGCGAAAAISASFNTPMAGVIFAMEVVMKEYSLESFIPVMAASVAASVLSQVVYGPDPAFIVPPIPMASLEELAISAVAAMVIGTLAALFIQINLFALRQRRQQVVLPIMTAGLLMGIAGFLVPASMGIGYDTIDALLNGTGLDIGFLLPLLLIKLVITALVIGLGVPGGVIGPSLMLGATAGTLVAMVAKQLLNLPDINITFHALTGMVAMMAAVLQAPLAALVTVLELTHNPQIILPAMLAIIIACLVASQLFRQQGVFAMQFKTMGKQVQISPLAQLLHRTGVASLMENQLVTTGRHMTPEALENQRANSRQWLLIQEESQTRHILASRKLPLQPPNPDSSPGSLDLLSVSGTIPAHTISMQATLYDALQMMNQHHVDALLVESLPGRATKSDDYCGVITRRVIEGHYEL